jgi:hypothetical protein
VYCAYDPSIIDPDPTRNWSAGRLKAK